MKRVHFLCFCLALINNGFAANTAPAKMHCLSVKIDPATTKFFGNTYRLSITTADSNEPPNGELAVSNSDYDHQAVFAYEDPTLFETLFFPYGLNPLLATGNDGPDADLDGDGLTNLQEFRLGTNPRKADTDGDQLPDGWEVKYGLNPVVAVGLEGGDADIDGDGLSNLEEYVGGTDPFDPTLLLRMKVEVTDAGTYRLSWPSEPEKKYQLQLARSVDGIYQDVASDGLPALGTGAPLIFEVAAEPEGSWFYRVKVLP